MVNSEEKGLLISQVTTDVTLISFLSVISVFFMGSVLPGFKSYELSVKIPISFLIIATFAFAFSALILSNATQSIREGNIKKVNKHLTYGYAISEYLGVFLVILSVPLAISIITDDLYLRVITFVTAIIGLGVYQLMGFSLLENHFAKSHRKIAVLIIFCGTIVFLSQVYAFHFTLISVLFLLLLLLITCIAPVKRFQ